ncbi:Myo-inositol transporter 2 [Galdieria sulphuraria]|uniref:MFS transporter, SP family, sugar:H+ symporter n=1 Tax=Galdieria sulphuraria TaxID=130081 RepID=M2Y365_GALSU|nr:MFS transporter, SP family, sugar:H+ symporter [Galdieria sulphuraria]EME30378.1 MFS transporter, SP family, sugar:H+ symporter [Galdieria sulphuraria]GJD08601.1 Myo-inositol transporter 2 [Galdieria sulphuraria]|eukprot:XP_005706898.1 MFS transporter, SP family, sugar:H+ symporter [Galdieria sulphuraria]
MIINPVESEAVKEKIEEANQEQFENISSLKDDLETADAKNQTEQVTDQDEGVTRTLQFFLFIACWGSTMMGMDLGLTGGASLYVIPDLHISSDHWSWISSGATWGSVLGSALATPISFVVGRRTVLLISSVTYIIGVVIATSTKTWGQLLAGRLIMGVGIGTEAMTIPIYISEVVPRSHRGGHLNIFNSLQALGTFLAWVVTAIFINVHPGSWRYILGSGFIGPAVQLVGLFFLPESPRYLMLKGKPEEARKCWRRFRRETLVSEQDYRDMCQRLQVELANRISFTQAMKEITTNPRIRATFIVGGVLSLSQQWNGATSVGYYMAILLSSLGLTDKTSDYVQMPIGFWSFCWTLPAYYWLDKYGRRKMLLISFPIFMIGELIAGSCIYVDNVHHRAAGFLIGMLIFYFGFQMGISPVAWVLNGEIYELHVRNYGMAWGAFLLLGSAASSTTSFSRQVSSLTLQGTFYFYVGVSLLFLIFHFIFLPETKGLLLEDVRELFNDGMVGLARRNLNNIRNSISLRFSASPKRK